MKIGRLSAFLAIVLTTACASFQRVPVPDWPRYEQGALAGFLEAPGERSVETVPGIAVRRIRGRIAINDDDRDRLQVHNYRDPRPKASFHGPEADAGSTEQLIDGFVFVVELRPSGSGQQMRTLTSRAGVFDFGPLPNGTYTLKATVVGWRAAVSTITVSDSADAAAQIRIVLKPAV